LAHRQSGAARPERAQIGASFFASLGVLHWLFFSVKMFSPRRGRAENVVFVSPRKQFLNLLMKGMAS
jgi:hypothetical protein